MALIDAATIAEYVAAGHWGDQTISQLVATHARQRPHALAVISEREVMTWRDYDDRASDLAAILAGLAPAGGRIAVLLPDGPDVHVAFVATERAGLVAVGVGPRAGDHEIEHLVTKTGASVLVTAATHRGRTAGELCAALGARGLRFDHVVALGESVTVDGEPARADRAALDGDRALGPNDLFLLNSTSGTTGLPKCVTQFQNRWIYFHQLAAEAGALTGTDVFMSAVPAPFGFGLWTSHFTPALLGAPVVVMERFTPELMIELIDRHHVTVLSCVSTQFVMLLNNPALDDHDLTSLRVMFTGGEPVPVARSTEFEERVGAAVLQFFGSNETGALSRTTLTDSRDKRLTTAGRVIPAMKVRLFDVETGAELPPGVPGQPAGRGPATCAGYYDDAAANEQLYTDDGWMLMGDICTVDADGYLTLVGRTSDVIIRGGKNISAVAVEQEVALHPLVRQAAAVGMPDPVYGERVCVFVESAAPLTLDDVVTHLRDRGVSPEWWPERLEVRDALPRSAGEKIAKGELRAEIERLLAP